MTAPAVVALQSADTIELTIHEGRNRQVRRMCAAVGHEVEALARVKVGGFALGDLPAGEWRRLRPEEVSRLEARS